MTDTKSLPNPAPPGILQEAWDEVCDNPELTDAELAEMRPVQECPEVYTLLSKRRNAEL